MLTMLKILFGKDLPNVPDHVKSAPGGGLEIDVEKLVKSKHFQEGVKIMAKVVEKHQEDEEKRMEAREKRAAALLAAEMAADEIYLEKVRERAAVLLATKMATEHRHRKSADT